MKKDDFELEISKKWIPEYPTGSDLGRCPVCKKIGILSWNQCPHCGSKMDG